MGDRGHGDVSPVPLPVGQGKRPHVSHIKRDIAKFCDTPFILSNNISVEIFYLFDIITFLYGSSPSLKVVIPSTS